MSGRVELYRESVEAWNRGDLGWYRGRIAEESEVRALRGFPGIDPVYFGPAGWEEFWNIWRDAWESVTITADRIEELDDESVRAVITFDGVGKESGAAVTLTAIHLVRFDARDRFVTSTTFWPDEAKQRWPDVEI